MDALADGLSRIIASSIPRRKALRLAVNMVGGGILAYLGLGRTSRALAQDSLPCGRGMVRCGRMCCDPSETCCGEMEICLPPKLAASVSCCGRGLCWKPTQQCCTDHCCHKTDTCCGTQCCSSGQACCHGQCCAPSAVCCGSHCCAPGQVCCNGTCYARRPSPNEPCLPS